MKKKRERKFWGYSYRWRENQAPHETYQGGRFYLRWEVGEVVPRYTWDDRPAGSITILSRERAAPPCPTPTAPPAHRTAGQQRTARTGRTAGRQKRSAASAWNTRRGMVA